MHRSATQNRSSFGCQCCGSDPIHVRWRVRGYCPAQLLGITASATEEDRTIQILVYTLKLSGLCKKTEKSPKARKTGYLIFF